MSNTVKTWRVTKDQLKVGNSPRLFGELIPEAGNWPPHTTAAYERSGYIEKVFVSQEEFDEFQNKQSEATSPASDSKKKKVVKKAKATSKKRVVKKSTAKEKDSGGNEDNRREGSGEAAEAGREEGSEEGSEEVLAEVTV